MQLPAVGCGKPKTGASPPALNHIKPTFSKNWWGKYLKSECFFASDKKNRIRRLQRSMLTHFLWFWMALCQKGSSRAALTTPKCTVHYNVNSVLQSHTVHDVSYNWKSKPWSRRTSRQNIWVPVSGIPPVPAEMKSKRTNRSKRTRIPSTCCIICEQAFMPHLCFVSALFKIWVNVFKVENIIHNHVKLSSTHTFRTVAAF